MGHHLYDENRQLKAEVEALKKINQDQRRVSDVTDVADLLTECIQSFFTGKAYLDILPGPNVEGSFMVFFRNPTTET